MKKSVSDAGRGITGLVAVPSGTLECLSYRSGSH